MRSSVVIDQTRRGVVKSREIVVRDLKAIKLLSKKHAWANSAGMALSRLRPRDVQVRRRCVVTGRGRGVLRRFRRSRIKVRELALRGELACVRKMTW